MFIFVVPAVEYVIAAGDTVVRIFFATYTF